MKYLLSLFFIITASVSFGQQVNENFIRETDELIPEMLEVYNVPGLSIAVVKDDKVVLCKGYGLSDIEKNILFDANTPGMLASATKFFTNLAILKAVKKGDLDLNLPLKDYLPEVNTDWQNIPLWRLLNLTSGIPATQNTPFEKMSEDEQRKLTYREYFNMISKLPLDFQPGTNWRYQQTTFAMMAMILSEKTGKSWQEIVQQDVLNPGGMKHTLHLEQVRNPSDLPINYEISNGKLVPAKFFYPLVQSTGAGYNTTAADMANLFLALNKNKIVPLELIQKEVFSIQRRFIEDSVTTEGYSIASEIKPYGKFLTMGHPGGLGIAVIRYSPDKKIGVAVLTNQKSTHLGTEVADKLLTSLLAGIPLNKQQISVAYAVRKHLVRHKNDNDMLLFAFYNSLNEHKEIYDLNNSEKDLNALGYSLLRDSNDDDALRVFKLNVQQFPGSANTYDSLGELYAKLGFKDLAILNYEKCLSLDPRIETARKMLKQLKSNN